MAVADLTPETGSPEGYSFERLASFDCPVCVKDGPCFCGKLGAKSLIVLIVCMFADMENQMGYLGTKL